MKTNRRSFIGRASIGSLAASAAALVLTIGLGAPARADDADAKTLLKAMSDYLAAQKTISFGYDTNLEVVTKDHQKFLLASSGTMRSQPARQIPRHAATAALPMSRWSLTARR